MSIIESREKKLKKRKGSSIIETAIILPICFASIFFIIKIGVLIYDSYSFSIVAHSLASNQAIDNPKQWQEELQKGMNQRLILPKEVQVFPKNKNQIIVEMKFNSLWKVSTTVHIPKSQTQKIYHMVNAKQLINRIPILEELQEHYFDALESIKK